MGITKLKSSSYEVEVFYPKEVRNILGIIIKRYRKNFKTKKEAEKASKDIEKKIQRVLNEQSARAFKLHGHIKFKEFYETVWFDMYVTASTGHFRQSPTATRFSNTKDVFRLHILPMFGEYSIKFLNASKDFVLKALIKKSQVYANTKIIKSYVN